MSSTTNVPVEKEACCSLLGKAYGRIIREGGTLSRTINIEERGNFGYPDTAGQNNKQNYNGRLAAVQYFQLNVLQIAAGAFTCDGINTKCCEGFAEGLKDAFLGLLEQTIHNIYQTSIPLGIPPPGVFDPIPQQNATPTVWGNVQIALIAAQSIVQNHFAITGSACGEQEP